MNRCFRADLPAWIFIGGLSSLPWLPVWATAAHGLDLKILLIAAVVSAVSFAWLGSFKIEITPTELVFRTLFGGRQAIKHDDIKIVRLEWKLLGTRKGPLRLVVEPRENSSAKKLDINAKVFSWAATKAVLDLGARVAQSDDGGLRDGIVLKSWRSRRQQK